MKPPDRTASFRLHEAVRRLPGESVPQLVRRAKELAVGQGVAVAFLYYCEVAH